MACTQTRSDALGELAGGRLAAPAVEELLAHLEDCAECSSELDAVAALTAATEEGAAVPTPATGRAVRSWMPWAAAAAGVLLLIFGRSMWPGAEGPVTLEELAVVSPLPAPPATLRGAPVGQEPLWSAAMESYRTGDYARAADELVALVEAGDERALTQLYLGIAWLQTGAGDAAEAALTRVESLDDGLLRERAEWYRANLFLQRGDAQGARALLEHIANDMGEYELNARELLSRLDALDDD